MDWSFYGIMPEIRFNDSTRDCTSNTWSIRGTPDILLLVLVYLILVFLISSKSVDVRFFMYGMKYLNCSIYNGRLMSKERFSAQVTRTKVKLPFLGLSVLNNQKPRLLILYDMDDFTERYDMDSQKKEI